MGKREIGEYSDKNFLNVLEFAVFYGFLGIHRIYVKRIFSGILYILNIIFFIPFFGRLELGFNFGTFLILILTLTIYVRWAVDLILIVSGRFKDKDKKIISNVFNLDYDSKVFRDSLYIYERKRMIYKKYFFNFAKKIAKDVEESKENSNFSDKNVVILYFLTGIRDHKALSGILGLYKFYSGDYKGGFLNVGVNIFNLVLFIIGIFLNCITFWGVAVLVMVVDYFILYLFIFRDRCKILSGEYKDFTGKKICLTYFKKNFI